MVFCSLKDAYGDEWKNSSNHTMTPCQPASFTTHDPYFDDQAQSGILNKLEKLEGKIEYFTKQATKQNKSIPQRSAQQHSAPRMREKFTSSSQNRRLENIIHYTLIAIFGALVVENMA